MLFNIMFEYKCLVNAIWSCSISLWQSSLISSFLSWHFHYPCHPMTASQTCSVAWTWQRLPPFSTNLSSHLSLWSGVACIIHHVCLGGLDHAAQAIKIAAVQTLPLVSSSIHEVECLRRGSSLIWHQCSTWFYVTPMWFLAHQLLLHERPAVLISSLSPYKSCTRTRLRHRRCEAGRAEEMTSSSTFNCNSATS